MSQSILLTPHTLLQTTHAQTSRELGGEAIILQFERGMYYGMDGVGARVWQLLQQPIAFEKIQATLLIEYDVSSSQLDADLHALIQRLLDAGLVEVCE